MTLSSSYILPINNDNTFIVRQRQGFGGSFHNALQEIIYKIIGYLPLKDIIAFTSINIAFFRIRYKGQYGVIIPMHCWRNAPNTKEIIDNQLLPHLDSRRIEQINSCFRPIMTIKTVKLLFNEFIKEEPLAVICARLKSYVKLTTIHIDCGPLGAAGTHALLKTVVETNLPLVNLTLINLSLSTSLESASLFATIYQCSQLRNLSLQDEQGFILPADIIQLKNLRNLQIINSTLIRLPPLLGQFTALESLSVYSENLTGLSREISQLQGLKSLQIFSSNLTRLPRRLKKLPHLRRVEIIGSIITQQPKKLWSWLFKQLHTLILVCAPHAEVRLNFTHLGHDKGVDYAVAQLKSLALLSALEINCTFLQEKEVIRLVESVIRSQLHDSKRCLTRLTLSKITCHFSVECFNRLKKLTTLEIIKLKFTLPNQASMSYYLNAMAMRAHADELFHYSSAVKDSRGGQFVDSRPSSPAAIYQSAVRDDVSHAAEVMRLAKKGVAKPSAKLLPYPRKTRGSFADKVASSLSKNSPGENNITDPLVLIMHGLIAS